MSKFTFEIDLDNVDDIKRTIAMLQSAVPEVQEFVASPPADDIEPPPVAVKELVNKIAAGETASVTELVSHETLVASPPADDIEPPQSLKEAFNAAPPPPAAGNETDTQGFPWDERIHAGSKAKVADGTWRKKRGVDEGLVAQVEAELRGDAPPAPEAPPAPDVPTAPPAPTASSVFIPETFPDLMVKITESGITADDLAPILAKHNIPSLGLLSAAPDSIKPIAMELFGDA